MTAILWGSALSPYFLKTEALCRYAGLPIVRRPDGGTTIENLGLLRRIRRAQRLGELRRWPHADPLDEYPLVPYLLTADGAVHYDSSAIAHWLDAGQAPDAGATTALLPREPQLAALCNFLDEAIDEVGLYCVHHHRWVVSRCDNDAGARLAHEFRSLLPRPLRRPYARYFARRQTRRLPYLFSVAPADARWPDDGLPRPPARAGYPPTHARLEAAWDELVDAAEHALRERPYLLGARFTLADASLYGQLGMNLSDPSSERRLRARAPRLRAWLDDIAGGRHVGSHGALRGGAALQPLLDWAQQNFVPLMQANAEAHARHRRQGVKCWNECAYDRGEARVDLHLRGAPAATVVKTFQVRVWRDLQDQLPQVVADRRTPAAARSRD